MCTTFSALLCILHIVFSRTNKISEFDNTGSGVSCFTLGFLAIFQNKINKSKSHFTSWHGLLGKLKYLILF